MLLPAYTFYLSQEERFYENTCIMDASGEFYISMLPHSCSFGDPSSVGVHVHDNKVFAPHKAANVKCGERSLHFADWMKLGLDPGSTIGEVPTNEEIISMGAAVLGVALL